MVFAIYLLTDFVVFYLSDSGPFDVFEIHAAVWVR
jgi:hypothetical protein